jgi:hypothetical protein
MTSGAIPAIGLGFLYFPIVFFVGWSEGAIGIVIAIAYVVIANAVLELIFQPTSVFRLPTLFSSCTLICAFLALVTGDPISVAGTWLLISLGAIGIGGLTAYAVRQWSEKVPGPN